MTIGSCIRTLYLPAFLGLATGFGGVPSPAAAQAGRLSDAAVMIEGMIAQGRDADAVAAARTFMRQVTQLAGFGVTNAHLTNSPATGYGIYELRGDNRYQPGEPVFAYVEVYGFSLTPQAMGTNQLLFDVTFTLLTPSGEQVTDAMISMGEIQLDSYSEPVDGYFHLTYRVTGITGAYDLRTVVTDRHSGQVSEFTLPVVFDDAARPQADK